MDVLKICRLCGETTGENSRSLFEKNKNGLQLLQIVKQYIPILVYRTDPLSKRICANCFEDLIRYFNFLHKCVSVQENFREVLTKEISDDNVQLYLNTLENHKSDYLSTLYVPYCKNSPTVDFSCQFTPDDLISITPQPLKRKFKILTPEVINEINEVRTQEIIPVKDDLGPPFKKRRLAGPKCINRKEIYNPLTLLQCALRKINEQILSREKDREEYESNSLLVHSRELYYYEEINYPSTDRKLFNEALHLCELSYDKLMGNINLNAPVECNYCMHKFSNILDLSRHEIGHISVDVGPKVDTQEYIKQYKHYYQMYLRAQSAKVTIENGVATLDENYDKFDSSNLLVPEPSVDSRFEIINEEVYLNGKPLIEYEKNDRKPYFKTLYINGIKKKFCPICRHTFKDNWGIDWHYTTKTCLYTCKYCGQKFKHQKELFPEHLKTHEGQPCNKIFGPTDKKGGKRKKVKIIKRSKAFSNFTNEPPRVKPLKMKTLFKKQAINTSLLKIKTEADLESYQPGEILRMDSSSAQQYQAFFCRKCFKVFFKIDEFNTHTQLCRGTGSESEASSADHSTNSTISKRPVRNVKSITDFSVFNDSDSESFGSNSLQNSPQVEDKNSGVQGYECGVCSSSFPTRHSRNSHMRIHKSQKIPADKVSNYLQKNLSLLKQESVQKQVQNANLIRQLNQSQNMQLAQQPQTSTPPIRLGNLNPMVARLVQNNPNLTIRSYTKTPQNNYNPPQEMVPRLTEHRNEPPKMGYRCGDCGERFENKSLLYHHKMNSCVVKRNFECAFCRKKFGSQEHYNIHMLHVHPE